ncbi:MAG: ZIP family metal transporter [Bacilli bacterium]|nr:ZIP family metal transporter [Bacilli bacterium]
MDPVISSLISLSIIFLATTLGSSFVFFFTKSLSPKMNNMILGFAGGIMVSASIFGLILPSIEESKTLFPDYSWLAPIAGFILGCLFLWTLDKVVPHFHENTGIEEGPKSSLNKNLKFFLAVTIHNIPEGLAVGFACGLALRGNDPALSWAAMSLAIGIAIQNVPEGAAVSIPMYSDGMKRGKAFTFGTMSGIVEPLFGVIGLFLAQLAMVTPWLLAFAAGAMIYVTLDEILPDSRKEGFEHYGLWAFIAGFVIMMALELLL